MTRIAVFPDNIQMRILCIFSPFPFLLLKAIPWVNGFQPRYDAHQHFFVPSLETRGVVPITTADPQGAWCHSSGSAIWQLLQWTKSRETA